MHADIRNLIQMFLQVLSEQGYLLFGNVCCEQGYLTHKERVISALPPFRNKFVWEPQDRCPSLWIDPRTNHLVHVFYQSYFFFLVWDIFYLSWPKLMLFFSGVSVRPDQNTSACPHFFLGRPPHRLARLMFKRLTRARTVLLPVGVDVPTTKLCLRGLHGLLSHAPIFHFNIQQWRVDTGLTPWKRIV